MSNNFESIENLIPSTRRNSDKDDDAQIKLKKKEKKIKLKKLEDIAREKSASLGVSYISLGDFPISLEALGLIDESEARILSIICFYYDGVNIKIASVDPANSLVEKKLKELEKTYHSRCDLFLVTKKSFEYAVELYKNVSKVKQVVRGIDITENDLKKYSDEFSSFSDLQKQIDQAQITDVIIVVMAASIKSGSSDIHVEAEEDEIKVRYRIDGMLHDVAHLKKDLWKKIISRLKGLSKVKINIMDKPQDGRFSINTKKERIDIRVSFLPTNFGESVVMRLLRSSSVGLSFEDLGICDKAFEKLKSQIERPNGMIMTTGPTGSGKTTTLYAILKKLNNPESKIITIEDPIEYQLKGINQSQTSAKYTFAHGLRSIVRQDPDVIMVGEIRDLDTAEIAIQAALTGHLVLSTIHTNDAAGAIPRFLSMGVKPFLLSPALNVIIGQRLVRKLCEKCKKKYEINKDIKIKAKEILEKMSDENKSKIDFNNLQFYHSAGCEACQSLGYKGRIGIYEIMPVNVEIEKIILSGKVSEHEMRDISVKNGMTTMVQDGLLKALDGVTSVEEVFRVAE